MADFPQNNYYRQTPPLAQLTHEGEGFVSSK